MFTDNKKLLILWAVIFLSYGFLIFFANSLRLSRFTALEQDAIFDELQQIWCTHSEIRNVEEKFAMRQDMRDLKNRLHITDIDMRMIALHGIEQEQTIALCVFQAATWTHCQNLDLSETVRATAVPNAIGLTAEEVNKIIAYGFGRDWQAHACYYAENLPIP